MQDRKSSVGNPGLEAPRLIPAPAHFFLRALALALAALLFASTSSEANIITWPDMEGDTGLYTSLALDASGNPVISYYDSSDGDLKVLHCDDPYCRGVEIARTPEAHGPNVGQYTSLALDSNGYPVVSYYDATSGDLKVLHCSNADCSAGGAITSPDPDDGTKDVGKYTSLALDDNDYPVISYYNATDGNLRVMHCNDQQCAGGDETPVSPDTGGNVGTSLVLDAGGDPVVSYMGNVSNLKILHCGSADCSSGNSIVSADLSSGSYSHLELDASGNPVVSYQRIAANDLKVMHCNDANCSGGDESITSPDTEGNVGYDTSLSLDGSGNPVVSYYDSTNTSLKVLHCGNANCTSGNKIVSAVGAHGATSLALDAGGKPVVSHKSLTNDLSLLYCDSADCSPSNSITVPDTTGNVGHYTSLVLDINGNPVVSYYDATNGDLKLLHCSSPDCSGVNSIVNVDSEDSVGQYTSVALDTAGNPVVSYYDETTTRLKVLHCGNANCTADTTPTTPDAAAWVGAFTSLELDAFDHPVVSYLDVANGDLKVLHCDDPNCDGDESGNIATPDSGLADVGYYTSLVLDGSGNPVISYYDSGANNNLKVLHCGNPGCTSGNSITSPDTGGDVGKWSSIQLDGAGNPVISYLDVTNQDVKVMHCNDANCAGGDESIASFDPLGYVDFATSLALDSTGNPVVSFSNKYTSGGAQEEMLVIRCGDSNCTDGNTMVPVDTYASVGAYVSLALDAAGRPVISYFDGGQGDLKVAHCSTPTCGLATISNLGGQYDNPGFSGDGGPAANAQLDSPHGVYETADDSVFLADTDNNRVRKIDGATGNINTLAGGGAGCVTNPTPPYDGCLGTEATLSAPRDVFVSSNPGDVFIADTGNNRIRKVDGTTSVITTFAGGGAGCVANPTPPYDGCLATQATLNSPRGVAIDEAGNVYIADTSNHRIRKVDKATGIITTVIGTGTQGYSGDGGAATSAQISSPHDVYPWGSTYAGTNDLVFADTGNNVIRWLHGPSGIVETLAGTGTAGFSGDTGAAPQAKLNAPEALAADATLTVYVADTQNDRIRRIRFGDATIDTVAGGGNGCAANTNPPYDGCPATDAVLDHPAGVAAGSLIGADTGNETVRAIDPTTGEPVGRFSGTTGCRKGATATIDLALLLVPLGLILTRRRLGLAAAGIRKAGSR